MTKHEYGIKRRNLKNGVNKIFEEEFDRLIMSQNVQRRHNSGWIIGR